MKKISALIALALLSCQMNKDEFDATGTFEATEVIVSAEESGKIMQFSAEEGTTLQEGEVVAVIDTVQLYLQKLALQANRNSVESQRPDIRKQIAATRQQIATAEREKTRTESLLEARAANRKQLDDWNAQIALLNRQLEAQLSSLEKSTSSLSEQSSAVAVQIAQIEDRLAKCRVASPIHGTVLAKYAEAGELATPGKPLFKVADTKRLFLRAYVTSTQLADIRVGQQVEVFADFGDEQYAPFTGTVTWIADEAEFTPKTILTNDERANQVYAVKIAIDNDGKAKIGMYGKVKFQLDEK